MALRNLVLTPYNKNVLKLSNKGVLLSFYYYPQLGCTYNFASQSIYKEWARYFVPMKSKYHPKIFK